MSEVGEGANSHNRFMSTKLLLTRELNKIMSNEYFLKTFKNPCGMFNEYLLPEKDKLTHSEIACPGGSDGNQ